MIFFLLSLILNMPDAEQSDLAVGTRRSTLAIRPRSALIRSRNTSRAFEDSNVRESATSDNTPSQIGTPCWDDTFRERSVSYPPTTPVPRVQLAPVMPPEEIQFPSDSDSDEENDEIVTIPGRGGSLCCHPQKFTQRMLVLFLMCLLGFGSYFCFDNPGALQVRLTCKLGS